MKKKYRVKETAHYKHRRSNDSGAGLLVIGFMAVFAIWGWCKWDDGELKTYQLQEITLSQVEADHTPEPEQPAFIDRLLAAVEQVESGGNPYAISPKGARGLFQIMPATARNPGLGVRPMRGFSVGEQRRFAREYLLALLDHYEGDVRRTLAAYNAGVGWVDSGAPLPLETRQYVGKVMRELARRTGEVVLAMSQ